MSKKSFDDKKIEARQILTGDERSSIGFCGAAMTALSLQLVSNSQNQQKAAVPPQYLTTEIISVGWNTDSHDKKTSNNQKFDSAVFLRSSDFKRHPDNRLH